MNLFSALILLTGMVLFFAVTEGRPSRSYTDKYDYLNVDEILSNDRLYRKYFDCLTGRGRCTPDGKELKDRLPEALATGCSKCTSRQKDGSDKVLRYMIEHRPDDWIVLEKIFDPRGEYRKRYRDEVLKKGIHLELVTEPSTETEMTTIA